MVGIGTAAALVVQGAARPPVLITWPLAEYLHTTSEKAVAVAVNTPNPDTEVGRPQLFYTAASRLLWQRAVGVVEVTAGGHLWCRRRRRRYSDFSNWPIGW